MGDPSPENDYKSGVIPSFAVKQLIQNGFNEKINLFLSLPSNPNLKKSLKKWNLNQMGL